jgi:hypothetical protein
MVAKTLLLVCKVTKTSEKNAGDCRCTLALDIREYVSVSSYILVIFSIFLVQRFFARAATYTLSLLVTYFLTWAHRYFDMAFSVPLYHPEDPGLRSDIIWPKLHGAWLSQVRPAPNSQIVLRGWTRLGARRKAVSIIMIVAGTIL